MNDFRKPRVAVVHHFFPHYRRAIVEKLSKSKIARFTFVGDNYDCQHGIKPAQFSSAVQFLHAPSRRLIGAFMWQWGAVRVALSPKFDVIILHGVVYWISMWVAGILARILGKQVFIWGHGYLYRPRGIKGFIRRIFYSIPQQHLLYGHRAKQFAIELGWPPQCLHVIYNSFNYREQIAARQRVIPERLAEIRRTLFGDARKKVVICMGRIIEIRRLDLLVQSIHLLNKSNQHVGLILIGDGPERVRLEALATELCVPVHFEGACYDENRIAELVMASTVTVAPGKVGLTAMHSMVYGIPVITNDDLDDQMPESEAIIPGKTGSFFRKNDVAALANAMKYWLEIPNTSRTAYASCLAIIDRFWNPDYQCRAIERAVCGKCADDLFDVREVDHG